MSAQFKASDVAEYFLWLSANECPDDPDYLTPMKLQKLLYYAQGWSLAETGRPLFGEEIEAWRDGPVVESVYQQFKRWEKRPIVEYPSRAPALTPEAEALVRSVWDRYKAYSAYRLSDMTHEEMPWKKARGGLARNAPSRVRIPLTDLEMEFKSQIERSRQRLLAHAKQVRAMARDRTRRTAPTWCRPSEPNQS